MTVGAVNDINVPRVEIVIRSNQYGSPRNPESLAKINSGAIVGNDRETPHLVTESRNNLDQSINQNNETRIIEDTFGQNDQAFPSCGNDRHEQVRHNREKFVTI